MNVAPLAEADLLAAWEDGIDAAPAVRGLELLVRAVPEEDQSALRGWPVGRQAVTLLELHSASFGELVEGHVPCPACGEELEVAFSARDLLGTAAPALDPLRLEEDGTVVGLRLPTVEDLLAAASAPTSAAARGLLLERAVVMAEMCGEQVEARSLQEGLVRRIGALLAEADPYADLTLTLTCPACETDARVEFDICDFLWRELDAHARELLEQVSSLAAAYGWSEPEILRLSPARRRFYLELVA